MTDITPELIERIKSRTAKALDSLAAFPGDQAIKIDISEVCDLIAALEAAQAENIKLRAALEPLYLAARGLSFGEDWNNGTQAKLHGYRQKLIAAIPSARSSLEGKL